MLTGPCSPLHVLSSSVALALDLSLPDWYIQWAAQKVFCARSLWKHRNWLLPVLHTELTRAQHNNPSFFFTAATPEVTFTTADAEPEPEPEPECEEAPVPLALDLPAMHRVRDREGGSDGIVFVQVRHRGPVVANFALSFAAAFLCKKSVSDGRCCRVSVSARSRVYRAPWRNARVCGSYIRKHTSGWTAAVFMRCQHRRRWTSCHSFRTRGQLPKYASASTSAKRCLFNVCAALDTYRLPLVHFPCTTPSTTWAGSTR